MNKRVFTLLSIAFAWLYTATAQESILTEPLPQKWPDEEELFLPTTANDDKWWHIFCDPRLDSLIVETTEGNFDLIATIENIRIAKAQWRQSQALMLPSLDIDA